MLLNYHIGCIVLGLLCVGVRVQFTMMHGPINIRCTACFLPKGHIAILPSDCMPQTVQS